LRSRLNQHGRDRALAPIETRLDDRTLGRRVHRRLQLQHLGLQQHVLEKTVHALAGACRDRDERRFAAVFLRHDPLRDQLLLHAIGIRLGLVDFIYRDDERDVRSLRVMDRLDRLRHHTVVRGDDQNHQIGDLRTARAHRSECLVARGVEERDDPARSGHVVRADVLRDPARLARGDAVRRM
jgi:hypothetical protein